MSTPHHLTDVVGFLRDFSADAVGFAETNVNWKHPGVFQRVNNMLRLGFGYARLSPSSSGLSSRTSHQAGGTLTALPGKWSGRKMDMGQDATVSFSWMRLRGRRGRRITIVACYRVVQGNGAGLGDSTAFVQQETVLLEQGHYNPNPK